MEFKVREEKGSLVAKVMTAELNFDVSEEFKTDLLALFNKSECKRLVLNMDKVGFIDSKAIGAMVTLRKSIVKNGGKLVLTDLQLYVKKIISVVTLNTIFDVFPTEKDALKAEQAWG